MRQDDEHAADAAGLQLEAALGDADDDGVDYEELADPVLLVLCPW